MITGCLEWYTISFLPVSQHSKSQAVLISIGMTMLPFLYSRSTPLLAASLRPWRFPLLPLLPGFPFVRLLLQRASTIRHRVLLEGALRWRMPRHFPSGCAVFAPAPLAFQTRIGRFVFTVRAEILRAISTATGKCCIRSAAIRTPGASGLLRRFHVSACVAGVCPCWITIGAQLASAPFTPSLVL